MHSHTQRPCSHLRTEGHFGIHGSTCLIYPYGESAVLSARRDRFLLLFAGADFLREKFYGEVLREKLWYVRSSTREVSVGILPHADFKSKLASGEVRILATDQRSA